MLAAGMLHAVQCWQLVRWRASLGWKGASKASAPGLQGVPQMQTHAGAVQHADKGKHMSSRVIQRGTWSASECTIKTAKPGTIIGSSTHTQRAKGGGYLVMFYNSMHPHDKTIYAL